jgi:hypothetical protein
LLILPNSRPVENGIAGVTIRRAGLFAEYISTLRCR